ncbi:3-deoxy-manno-octulosonate cytidylyltransferase [Bacteroidota bacterium]
MNYLGIIPARYASTRFPGKPLIIIDGKTMIQRVYEQAIKAISTVVVATDDSRIEKEVKSFGGLVVNTSSAHKSGTDRCREAAEKILSSTGENFDIIINIQGDEPFFDPKLISEVISCFTNEKTQIASLAKKILTDKDLFDQNTPKVVLKSNNEALYFSRAPIPFFMGLDKKDWLSNSTYYKHIGIYAYRIDILHSITSLGQSSLEIAESLEQNRWLENGYHIQMAITQHESISIDTKDDLENILHKISNKK